MGAGFYKLIGLPLLIVEKHGIKVYDNELWISEPFFTTVKIDEIEGIIETENGVLMRSERGSIHFYNDDTYPVITFHRTDKI